MQLYNNNISILLRLLKLILFFVFININGFTKISYKEKINKEIINSNNIIYYKKYKYLITNIKYFFSIKFKRIRLEYNIAIYDDKDNLISPFDMKLYYDISTICNIKIIIQM